MTRHELTSRGALVPPQSLRLWLATGMGFGTLANRPATCTTNALESGGGVGYFATDQGAQGTFHRCSATNTWTGWYVPYTYPHPLVATP